ncbi:MAG: peptide deformylase [Lachnospiraceae bacterium]|jgi:peptide deformylase|nr:peptide deformylase [Lachnospiraceae bacterium]MBQ2022267.1 peptide deformylase [Lachnospiraceae bacterium]MBQ2106676.1 peptide deformylase [Lachnospiraceae bacterium]MBQ2250263.1 peptide deformylase [Lachnospiraceae bacterium]MBQ2402050.1 peptide deformylase [Lachnospiraceae bacterium]
MAIREVRTIGDEVLGKISKPVKEVNERTLQIIEDMFETMYETGGVGIAAPQVGILKRIVCMDVGDGNQYLMINPEIIELSGEQTGMEGCLSVPGKRGQVTRANYAKVKAFNENMEEIIIEGEGLLARCIQHECDHLDGILYVTKVEGELVDKEVEEDEDEE